jgi:hydroxymethylglutaryl-CoA lyase
MNQLRPVALFDVSLRDGIQSTKSTEKYTTEYKKQILETIIQTKNPEFIEVGSFVSPRALPIMTDTEEILQHGIEYAQKINKKQNYYVLIPSMKQLLRAAESPVIKQHINPLESSIHFSFITSVSESFQQKNIKKSIVETKQELKQMTSWLQQHWPSAMTKLYVSCINECPIEGKISNDTIIEEIHDYNRNYQFDDICLSDTVGKLEPSVLDPLLYDLKQVPFLSLSKLSLHLHGKDSERIRDLLTISDIRGIHRYDVSMIEEGGCSVTMGKENTQPNLTYEIVDSVFEYTHIRKNTEF